MDNIDVGTPPPSIPYPFFTSLMKTRGTSRKKALNEIIPRVEGPTELFVAVHYVPYPNKSSHVSDSVAA